jgi:YggT family protein
VDVNHPHHDFAHDVVAESAEASRCRSTLIPRGMPMRAVLDVVMLALNIYTWLLIASAVLSWLIAFNVVNTRNQFVATVWDSLYKITEPALRPIRERLPNLGGIDISPIILLLLIFFIQSIIVRYIYPAVF